MTQENDYQIQCTVSNKTKEIATATCWNIFPSGGVLLTVYQICIRDMIFSFAVANLDDLQWKLLGQV